MAVDERSRRLLFDRLEEVLGVGQGDALMAYLPPVGWAEVATKRDLEHLEQQLEHRFARIDDRFDRLDDRLADRFATQSAQITAAFRGEINAAMTLQIRQTVFAIIGVLLAVAGLVAAVLGLG